MQAGFLFFVARRYLFSKQKQHVINLITGVSMVGVAVGTMALVIVLSVLNGFESVVQESFNNFDPELRIEAAEGKSFDTNHERLKAVKELKEVAIYSEEVQEMALLSLDEQQLPILVKGVDGKFSQLTRIDTLVYSGKFDISSDYDIRGVIGAGVSHKFHIGVDYNTPMQLYAPRRNARINPARPDQAFLQRPFFVSGIFAVNQPQYDDQLVMLPIALVRELFEYPDSVATAVSLKMVRPEEINSVKAEVKKLLGNEFVVLDQYEQQADFYRILQIEKWITFLILAFILLIATCNVIGSLSMLMIDKRRDIELFKSLGATRGQLRMLFLMEGWMITIVGALIGLLLALVICFVQMQWGVVKMGTGFIVQSYPVLLQWGDLVAVFFTVLAMGFLAAYYPASLIDRKQQS